ncbi:MAG: DUF1569 domain-containing protein [Ferruginibacter sp.]
MKSIFDQSTRDEIINRIRTLNENSKAQWGKMNVYQMIKHCVLAEEMFLGKREHKRAFIGKLFGRIALKGMLKNEKPIARNSPTSAHFIVKEQDGDIFSAKQQWIALVEDYAKFSNDAFVHWFFGKMTKEQVGYFTYKHIDHHLRQFNCQAI